MPSPLEFLLRLLLVAGEISDGCVSGGIGDTAGPVAVVNKVDTPVAVGKAEKHKATKSTTAHRHFSANMPPPANDDKYSNTEVIDFTHNKKDARIYTASGTFQRGSP